MTNYKKINPHHRFDFARKHYADLWKAMKPLLDEEPHDATLNDVKLAEAIKAKGVYATTTTVRNCRLEHDVPNADERVITNYARDFKRGKITTKGVANES